MPEPIIVAEIANLGKYAEGRIASATLGFPTAPDVVEDCLKRIGVDGKRYEEIIITEYSSTVDGLTNHLPEYAHIDELNYLASLLYRMDTDELEQFEAAIADDIYTGELKDLINLAQNLDCYTFIPEVHDEEELGHYYVDALQRLDVPEEARPYFDYEAYGRDTSINENGSFTDHGYTYDNRTQFVEHYDGKEVPEEYRVFSYTAEERAQQKPSIRAALKASQEAKADGPERTEKPQKSHGPEL